MISIATNSILHDVVINTKEGAEALVNALEESERWCEVENMDTVFKCRKCEHLLFVNKISNIKMEELLHMECPECGEEGYENWVLSRVGDFNDEYGVRD